ncbi:hypothetical protein LG293_16505 (plasmid) [Citricoccus nitrophenolicus]
MSPSSKPQIDHSDRSGIAIAGTGLALAAVIGFGGLVAGGFMPGKAEIVEEPVAEAKVAVQVSSAAPAALTVPQQLLESPGTGVDPDGSVMGSATTPWPMGCATEDSPMPLASLSRGMNTEAGRVQVTVQSFAPGAGAQAFADQADAAPSCKGGAGFSWQGEAGTEQAVWSGKANGTSFRSGDVIVHVAGAGPRAAATTLSDTLDSLLGAVCTDLDSDAADYARNPLSPDPGPWMVQTTAVIDDPGLPQLPVGVDYRPTSIPAVGLVNAEDVTPKESPSWPVWPLMPEAVEKPSVPQAPEAEPVLSKKVEVEREDLSGPGCGWAWTGQAGSTFDAGAVQLTNLGTNLAAMGELGAAAKSWQDSVAAYWKGVSEYSAKVIPWNDYVAEVQQVNAAWQVIEDGWARYRDELESWEENERQIEQFNASRDSAQELWQQNLRQCLTDNGQPVLDTPEDVAAEASLITREAVAIIPAAQLTPSPTPTAEPSPEEPTSPDADPAPSPEATPGDSEPAPDPVDCVSVFPRPDILDMQGPSPYDQPAEPADPRPENWEQIAAGEVEATEEQVKSGR